MQLQDFNRNKHRGGMENCFVKIVKRRGSLIKLGALLKICLFAWDIDVFWIIIGGQSQGNLGNYCRYSGKDLHIIQG